MEANTMGEEKKLIRLDIGCGVRKRTDGEWIGVDAMEFPGVDVVSDALTYLKTLGDNSVDEVNMSHFLEHLDGPERVVFINELYRIIKPGAKCLVTCPSWSSERAYGDPSHKWPPVCTWTFFYMDRNWREVQQNAPHCGYTCDFECGVVGTLDPNDPYIGFRNNETKQAMMGHQINVTQDIVATLTKRAAS
jgi:hypothetical protein